MKTRAIPMPDSLMVEIDRWRAQQSDIPSKSEAVRRLIRLGLGLPETESDATQELGGVIDE